MFLNASNQLGYLFLALAIPIAAQENSKESTASPSPEQIADDMASDDGLLKSTYLTLIVVSCLIVLLGLTVAGVCWYRYSVLNTTAQRVFYQSTDSSVLIQNGKGQVSAKQNNGTDQLKGLTTRRDYPSYGITGPNPLNEDVQNKPVIEENRRIDHKTSKSPEVFHYSQTKNRMKAMTGSTIEYSSSSKTHVPLDVGNDSKIDDEETSDGELTVYECSGYASTIDGPMEIHNPLFEDISELGDVKTRYISQEGCSQSCTPAQHLETS